MRFSGWKAASSKNGWRVAIDGGEVIARCRKIGCPGATSFPLEALPAAPLEPCALEHCGRYGKGVVDNYAARVRDLAKRRVSLGLSQEDVTDAAGFPDGYINKLEALARIPRMDTFAIWTQTLGLAFDIVDLDD